MASNALIGIDIGTSGVKAVLIDESGRVIASAYAEYPLALPQPGWAEQYPEDWVQAAVHTIRELLAKAPGMAGEVRGLALSGQMHGLVCLDKEGGVLRPAILWCDTRTSPQCHQVEEALGGTAGVVRQTFNAALEGFTLPKLLWVKQHQPDVFQRIHTILLPKDYVRFRLTGERGMDLSDAAGTLLLDVGRQEWSAEVAAAVGVDLRILPPLGQSSAIAGILTDAMAAATGLPAGLPIAFGGADNACAAVGTGVVREGTMAVSIGTSGTVIMPVTRPVYDPQGRLHTFLHAVPRVWYVMGVMQAAGLSMKWVKDNFCELEASVAGDAGQDVYDILTAEAAAIAPGAEGLLWLPYLNGERTPHMDPNARGVLFGISPRHTKAHVVRAVMEGVAFGLKDSLMLMDELGISVSEIRITGGGGHSPLWRQIIADVFQKPVSTVNGDEGPALGAAIIAGVAVGVFPDFPSATGRHIRVEETSEPNPLLAKDYQQSYERFGRLYRALQEEFAAAVRVH